jgi:hypothetical protein
MSPELAWSSICRLPFVSGSIVGVGLWIALRRINWKASMPNRGKFDPYQFAAPA